MARLIWMSLGVLMLTAKALSLPRTLYPGGADSMLEPATGPTATRRLLATGTVSYNCTHGFDYNGRDLSSQPVSGQDQCQQSCDSSDACTFYVLKADGTCFLKAGNVAGPDGTTGPAADVVMACDKLSTPNPGSDYNCSEQQDYAGTELASFQVATTDACYMACSQMTECTFSVLGTDNKCWLKKDLNSGTAGRTGPSPAVNQACIKQASEGTLPGNAQGGGQGNTTSYVCSGQAPSWYPDCTALHDLAVKFAPILKFDAKEKYFPSDVQLFLSHTHMDTSERAEGVLTTNDLLPEPSTRLDWFYGTNPSTESAPVYCVAVQRSQNIIDLVYLTFYPYNYGKTINTKAIVTPASGTILCTLGLAIPFVAPACLTGALTAAADVGTDCDNHVGDWEAVTVRVQLNTDGTAALLQVGGSRHGPGYTWSGDDLEVSDSGHPVLYPAYGGHGLYNKPGKSPNDNPALKALGALGTGLDEFHNGDGVTWDTSGNVMLKVLGSNCPDVGDFSWWPITSQWGNTRRGCALTDGCAGQCRLSDGPDAPRMHNLGCGLWTVCNNAWCPAF